MDVYTKCSNYATDTCPCVLAENGKCIECSLCHGEDYCTCSDTVSFCILQELINHGGKARQQHRSMRCEVRHAEAYGDAFRFIRIAVGNAADFKKLGSFVFVRVDENPFYDVPISVLYEEHSTDTIGLIIQMVGTKTNSFRTVREGDFIYMRGPFYNGLQGRSAVAHLHDSRAAVICRGIGLIPSLHVVRALCQNNNAVDFYLDWGKLSKQPMGFYEELQQINVNEVRITDQQGEPTEEFRRLVAKASENGIELIHLGLSDYLLKKTIGMIEHDDPHHRMAVSYTNNSHLCCGEGICGACTKNADARRTIHLCKEQLNLYEYGKLI